MNDRIKALKSLITKQTEDIEAFKTLFDKEFLAFDAKDELYRKSHFLSEFAKNIPVVMDENDIFAGSGRFWCTRKKSYSVGHIIVDYRTVLSIGIPGIKDKISRLTTDAANAFAEALDAFCVYIERHAKRAQEMGLTQIAEDCRAVTAAPPATFRQALQLIWFMQIFLHAEALAAGISFGRFDEYMYPFYKADIESGRLTSSEAFELISAFYIKTCEGDESQNLTLGGGFENELTLMCLDVMSDVRVKQPSLSLRIGRNTSDALWLAAARLMKCGIGQPGFFCDSVIVRSLKNLGIADEDAENYGVVGCYETNPSGMTFGTTSCGGMMYLHDILLGFIGDREKWEGRDSFEGYLDAFLGYFKYKYDTDVMELFRFNWAKIKWRCLSPFESICFGTCLESGMPVEAGGCKYTMFGINILGIGTLIDSLYAVKKLVYDFKEISLTDFMSAVKNNFADGQLGKRCRDLEGKYGTDFAETNELASRLSNYIADLVASSDLGEGVIPYAGLFASLEDVNLPDVPATPDGRLRGERLSYGISATDICKGKTVTSVMNSAAHIANERFADGNPLLFNLDLNGASDEDAATLIKALIGTYFEKGGFHVQFNTADKDSMIAAQRVPENYSDLTVRISGYSDYFTKISPKIQNALIERL